MGRIRCSQHSFSTATHYPPTNRPRQMNNSSTCFKKAQKKPFSLFLENCVIPHKSYDTLWIKHVLLYCLLGLGKNGDERRRYLVQGELVYCIMTIWDFFNTRVNTDPNTHRILLLALWYFFFFLPPTHPEPQRSLGNSLSNLWLVLYESCSEEIGD